MPAGAISRPLRVVLGLACVGFFSGPAHLGRRIRIAKILGKRRSPGIRTSDLQRRNQRAQPLGHALACANISLSLFLFFPLFCFTFFPFFLFSVFLFYFLYPFLFFCFPSFIFSFSFLFCFRFFFLVLFCFRFILSFYCFSINLIFVSFIWKIFVFSVFFYPTQI